MDIRNVRSKFQKDIDFLVVTNYTTDLSHASYNLQQESLNSDVFLHIRNNAAPNLEGHLININSQEYIVYKQLKEPFSLNHYIYQVLPVFVQVEVAEITTTQNAIGASNPVVGEYCSYSAYLDTNATTEMRRPTQQPVQMYKQTFSFAAEQLDVSKEYSLKYEGRFFKLKSRLSDNGIVKIIAIEDV